MPNNEKCCDLCEDSVPGGCTQPNCKCHQPAMESHKDAPDGGDWMSHPPKDAVTAIAESKSGDDTKDIDLSTTPPTPERCDNCKWDGKKHDLKNGENFTVNEDGRCAVCGRQPTTPEREEWGVEFDRLMEEVYQLAISMKMDAVEQKFKSFLRHTIERELERERAKERLRATEILHKYAMKTKTTKELDMLEAAQRDILSLLP